MMNTRTACLVSTFAIAASVNCSFVLESKGAQCEVDADCLHFGSHPLCQQGVCVASGLGPDGCYLGPMSEQWQFASQCTTAKTEAFDNCKRLHLCDDTALVSAMSRTRSPTPTAPPSTPPDETPSVTCASADPRGNIIYITGSTNLPPLLEAVQPLLYADTPPYTIVFAPQTSCKGAASIYDRDLNKHRISDPPAIPNWAFYYARNGVKTPCTLAAGGNVIDVGETDVYPSTCGYSPQADVADYPGPIQAITFVVPSGSSQTSISAEAAHLVFGTGGNDGVTSPWTDSAFYFIRSSGTGTVQLPSRAIGVEPTAWWGIDLLSAANLAKSMETLDPIFAEKALGILSSDFADRHRANLRILAFQQHGQRFAYLPDSTPEAFDKANVRDGHYPIWGAIHFVAATSNGRPSAAAQALIAQFNVAKLDEKLVSAIIDAGYVPLCAMKVNHTTEVGPLETFQPKFACGCFFDKQTNGSNTCHACVTPSDCATVPGAPACNYGFCERGPEVITSIQM